MAHADLFISSSRYEGSPNAVLESLACGTPVLAFDCPGGTKEIICEDENGWLVPGEDIGAMATKLIKIVKKKAWNSLDAHSLLPSKHSIENVMAVTEQIFDE
jgi:glycosyltransferase involved in cell wall biosynthesis